MWPTPLLLLLPAVLPWLVTAASPSPNDRHLLHSKTCPRSCADATELAEWSSFHDLESLTVCPEPVLLKFNLYTPFDDPETHVSIRACTLGDALTEDNLLTEVGHVALDAKNETSSSPETLSRRGLNDTISYGNFTCGSAPASREAEVTARLTSWTGTDPRSPTISVEVNPQLAVALAIEKLTDHMKMEKSCEKEVLFAYVRGTLVGLYSGALVDKRKTTASVLQGLLSGEMKGASPVRKAVEICGGDRSASTAFGVVADTSGDFGALQKIVRAWNEGECAPGSSDVAEVKARVWTFDVAVSDPPPHPLLRKRADCRSIRVEPNDSCAKLATRCGISGTAFQNFNRATSNLCSTLRPGQPVCCSSGTLPDIRPKPGADGTCAKHDVRADEGCQVIATKYGIKLEDLDKFNKKTWGWNGCKNLLLAQRICVSEGKPPMPAPVSDAICGPTKPGSKPPANGGNLADLNPCPISVCCNVWGKCGTTSDFCVVSKTATGNPGTSKPGENGCVSNCGMEIVNNGTPPAQFRKITYFEAWNYERPCLNMHVLDVDKSYTHVHFAFGEISPDHNVVIPDNQREQWEAFVSARNFPKKVLAFGGWAFSNEGPNARLLREVVSPANRERFAERVTRFAVDNGLSGLDFDWEYPGATDIDGSPPGEKEDGENYYQFLKLVRAKLPKDKSLSIATPASYWYLRGFPIKKMAELLDYIVYMTYDFHGQWDVGNKWAQPGCPSGTCLRSHINSTTTHDSLVMITKAGVPSHKVVVGVSSYGRSFKMADPNCRGPMCKYLGARNDSPAKKGRCTGTGGYISDFEINEIIAKGGAISSWYSKDTDSDYLVYDRVEYVAYMSKATKSRRTQDYKKLNFGGTSDWAVDLQGEGSGNGSGRPVYLDPEVYGNGGGAHCSPPCVLVFPPSALPSPTTINPGTYVSSLQYGAMSKTTVGGKETTAFVTKITTITVSIPPVTVSSMSYSNVNITAGQKGTELQLAPSIRVGPVSIPVPNGEGGTTTRTLVLPPWPAITDRPGSKTSRPTGGTSRPPSGGASGPRPTWPPPRPTGTGASPPGPTPGNSAEVLPTYTTYPPYRITPVPEHVEDVEVDDDGFVTPCNLWFFNICLGGKDSKIGGLKWILPPGVYPPGPPPPNILGPPGPGPIIQPPLPPWPPVTIGRDNRPTFTQKPDCETDSASICSTTKTISTITVGPTTTKATSTRIECETIYGCSLTDWETEITTRTAVCAVPTRRPRAIGMDLSKPEGHRRQKRQAGCGKDIAVVPMDVGNVRDILEIFEDNDVEEDKIKKIYSEKLDLLFLYIVLDADDDLIHDLEILRFRTNPAVHSVIELKDTNPDGASTSPAGGFGNSPRPRGESGDGQAAPPDSDRPKKTTETLLRKRASVRKQTKFWAPSQVSLVRTERFMDPEGMSYVENAPDKFVYYYDEVAGLGQYVYVVGESDLLGDFFDFAKLKAEGRFDELSPNLGYQTPGKPGPNAHVHGTMVAAMAVGEQLGVCVKCNLVFVRHPFQGLSTIQLMHDLVTALDHIIASDRKGRAVINMSWGTLIGDGGLVYTLGRILQKLESEAKAVLVNSAGNYEDPRDKQIDTWPQLFGKGPPHPEIPGSLIVVGSTYPYGDESHQSRHGDWIATYAPGEFLDGPNGPRDTKPGYMGTSYAAPMVAGLAAYLRSLNSPWKAQLEKPTNVKKMIRIMHRHILSNDESGATIPGNVPIIWNGQVGDKSCLSDYDTRAQWDDTNLCPEINKNLDDVSEDEIEPITSPGGDDAESKQIDWSEGPDSPKCKSTSGTCGGELCRGYYCVPNPVGVPPDFQDPKDPKGPTGPNAGPGDPEDEDEPDGPSPYDWGIRWYEKGCEKQIGKDQPGFGEVGCMPVDTMPIERFGISGFTKSNLKACFYNNRDCAAESSSEYYMFSGGDRITDGDDCVGGSKNVIRGFRITEDASCVDSDGYWGIDWYSDKCNGIVARSKGTGASKCSTEIPGSGEAAKGFTLGGNLVITLYENTKCDDSGTDFVLIGGGSPQKDGECLRSWHGKWGSYKVEGG